MTRENENNAAPGDYDAWANSNVVRLFTVKEGKNVGEPKAVIQLRADVGGIIEAVDVMVTLDPKATTAAGKKRILFSIEAFNAIGATNALSEIGAALEADKNCAAVTLSGVMSPEGKPLVLATLNVTAPGEYTNYNLYAKRKPMAAGLGAELAKLGAKGGQAAGPAVNPFAKPAADAAGSFDFGANAPTPAT